MHMHSRQLSEIASAIPPRRESPSFSTRLVQILALQVPCYKQTQTSVQNILVQLRIYGCLLSKQGSTTEVVESDPTSKLQIVLKNLFGAIEQGARHTVKRVSCNPSVNWCSSGEGQELEGGRQMRDDHQ